MYWPAGVQLAQQALLMAFWLSLPLLASISAAGLAGGLLQGTLGHSDPATLVAVKLLAGGIALIFFGAWMVSFTAEYWTGMWLAAVELAR
ncbi:MAG: flagellar biosynthetic protein FliQ [Armatimonadota bacterium]|jgi:type III secretion protein S